MKRVIGIAVAVVAAFYIAEDVSVRYRIPRSRDPIGTVKVESYYAVRQKSGKDEYYFNPPQDQACVRAVFPHLGYRPCWYVARHATKKISV